VLVGTDEKRKDIYRIILADERSAPFSIFAFSSGTQRERNVSY